MPSRNFAMTMSRSLLRHFSQHWIITKSLKLSYSFLCTEAKYDPFLIFIYLRSLFFQDKIVSYLSSKVFHYVLFVYFYVEDLFSLVLSDFLVIHYLYRIVSFLYIRIILLKIRIYYFEIYLLYFRIMFTSHHLEIIFISRGLMYECLRWIQLNVPIQNDSVLFSHNYNIHYILLRIHFQQFLTFVGIEQYLIHISPLFIE